MTIDPKELFGSSFFITIDGGRADLFRKAFSRAFSSEGWPMPTESRGYYDPSKKSTFCCEMSHMLLVKAAKAEGLPFVAIFEDDAYPRTDAADMLRELLSDVPDDAHALVMGWNKLGARERSRGRCSRLKSYCWGSHAYVVFESWYDAYLSEYGRSPDAPSDLFFEKSDRCYVSNENLFIQYCSKKSMNGWSGYVYDNGKHGNPPSGFPRIGELLNGERVNEPAKGESLPVSYLSNPYFYGAF